VSFEDDVMILANSIKDKAIWRTWERKEGEETNLYARGGPEAYYAPIVDMFRPYSQMPDPAGHDTIAEQVMQVLRLLSPGSSGPDRLHPIPANPNLGMIPGSESYLERWTGRAAVEFKQRFLDPFPYLVANQYLLASTLYGAIDAQARMWENARRDILEIGNATLNALNTREPFLCCGGTSGATKVILTTIEAIATVAAVFMPTASVGARVGIEIVAVAASAAATLAPDQAGPTVDMAAEYTWDIIANMAAAIRLLNDQIYQAELKIRLAMQAALALADQNPDLFVAPRPALAGATAANIASPEYMGYSINA
jgi:hypothetical protein